MKLQPLDLKPEDLHNWYLEATKELNPESYNPDAQKPYDELTDEQKFIDKFVCSRIKQHVKSAVMGLLNDIENEYNAIAAGDTPEDLWHCWDKHFAPMIQSAEKYIVPLSWEERAEFVAKIVWSLGRSSQLAILKMIKEKINKWFKDVIEE